MYTIIDIETTGNGIKGNKITEIAIFKYDGEKVVDEFTSLVNPLCPIPYFITGLTGIDDQMVANAPTFNEIADQVLEMTQNCVFVAHSVNFDYGVIKEEFRQLGVDFVRKKLCTVRLSRKLIPGLRSYSLGKLCSAVGIPITDRHRARGDAHATTILFQKLLQHPDAEETLNRSLNARSQEATLPPLLSKQVVNALPQSPGIYFFKNKSGEIIYIGKAINIKKRVLGHFYDKSTKELRMCREIAAIDYELSGNELLALLMESTAIKHHFPQFNRAQKRITRSYSIFEYEDRKGYRHLAYGLSQKCPNRIKTFYRQQDCRTFLKQLCDTYGLCEKYTQLRKVNCDGLLINCFGACQGLESPDKYNERVTNALEEIANAHQSFYIKERGRTKDEDALIYIYEGMYRGYAFIPRETNINSVEDVEAFLTLQRHTIETDSIISGYLIRNRERIFSSEELVDNIA